MATQATYVKGANLRTSTTYTATISGAKDLDNNTLSPFSWSFRTTDYYTATYTTQFPLNLSTWYVATVSGVKNETNDQLDPFSWNFRTSDGITPTPSGGTVRTYRIYAPNPREIRRIEIIFQD